MIPPRTIKAFRIARKLAAISHELPDPDKAAFFLRNCVRFERVMNHLPPFHNPQEVFQVAEKK